MKKTLLGIIIGAAVVVAALAIVRLRENRAPDRLTVDAVMDNIDVTRNTELHAREYWKKYQNQELSSAGIVVDVKAKGRLSEVIVLNKTKNSPRGANMVLTVPDVARAAELKKNEFIRFKGIMDDYKGGDGRGATLYLINVEIAP